jgi:hypothetical protein
MSGGMEFSIKAVPAELARARIHTLTADHAPAPPVWYYSFRKSADANDVIRNMDRSTGSVDTCCIDQGPKQLGNAVCVVYTQLCYHYNKPGSNIKG